MLLSEARQENKIKLLAVIFFSLQGWGWVVGSVTRKEAMWWWRRRGGGGFESEAENMMSKCQMGENYV